MSWKKRIGITYRSQNVSLIETKYCLSFEVYYKKNIKDSKLRERQTDRQIVSIIIRITELGPIY